MFLFNEFSIFSICSSSRLFSLIDLIKETILGLFSIYSPISGATLPLEIPAKSLRILNPSYINIQPKFKAAREGDVVHSEGSIVRLNTCLNWSPAIPFDDGIHELVKFQLEKVD